MVSRRGGETGRRIGKQDIPGNDGDLCVPLGLVAVLIDPAQLIRVGASSRHRAVYKSQAARHTQLPIDIGHHLEKGFLLLVQAFFKETAQIGCRRHHAEVFGRAQSANTLRGQLPVLSHGRKVESTQTAAIGNYVQRLARLHRRKTCR